MKFKKTIFLGLTLFIGFTFVACSNDDNDTLVQEEGNVLKLNIGTEIGITHSETKATTASLCAIQVYSRTARSDDEYSPCMLGLFKDLNDIKINTKRNKEYKFACGFIDDGYKCCYPQTKFGAPFSTSGETGFGSAASPLNTFVESSDYFNLLKTSGINREAGMDYYSYLNRFYGEAEAAENAGTVNLQLGIEFFRITYNLQGLASEGYILASIRNQEALEGAKISEVQTFSSSLISSQEYYNLLNIGSDTEETVWVELKYYTHPEATPITKTLELAVKKKKNYTINIDVDQSFNITLEDESSFSDGSTTEIKF